MSSPSTIKPNYIALVRFLVTPFLEFPDALVVDCETYGRDQKVLVRLAFAASDKGRVFGRGGRTLNAIRTVVETAAKLAGQAVHLEVFGERETASGPPLREAASPPPTRNGSTVPRPRIVKGEASQPKFDS
ncbi:MAG: KH domain-containing protein [Thermosynechococcaceae cyanobacterium]